MNMGIVCIVVLDRVPMQFAPLFLFQVIHDTACPLTPVGNVFVLTRGQHDFMIGYLSMGMVHDILHSGVTCDPILVRGPDTTVLAALVALAMPVLDIFEVCDESRL